MPAQSLVRIRFAKTDRPLGGNPRKPAGHTNRARTPEKTPPGDPIPQNPKTETSEQIEPDGPAPPMSIRQDWLHQTSGSTRGNWDDSED
jgi:hypothetical protein